jgi:site-specific recombinase XerD
MPYSARVVAPDSTAELPPAINSRQTVADAHPWKKKTYNNALSALRRAFEFGYRDYPEKRDPAAALKGARIDKRDRPVIDPFSIQQAEQLIAARHRDWGEAQGNYDEFRFFTGLRPSEQIALLVTDYDRAHRTLSITRARVAGVDKDVTKTGNDRRIVLSPRAVAVLERQFALRERLRRAGRIDHEHLFFTAAGEPIRRLYTPYSHWRTTLRRLPIQYRRPYAARHSSVSWDLIIGRNPLWVAKQHGHSLLTMLRVYAAWAAYAPETGVVAIQEATGYVNRNRDPHGTSGFQNRLAVDLPVAGGRIEPSAGKSGIIRHLCDRNRPDKIDGGEGGIRTHVPVLPDHPISSRRRYDRFGTSPSLPKIPRRRHIMVNRRVSAPCGGNPGP